MFKHILSTLTGLENGTKSVRNVDLLKGSHYCHVTVYNCSHVLLGWVLWPDWMMRNVAYIMCAIVTLYSFYKAFLLLIFNDVFSSSGV